MIVRALCVLCAAVGVGRVGVRQEREHVQVRLFMCGAPGRTVRKSAACSSPAAPLLVGRTRCERVDG